MSGMRDEMETGHTAEASRAKLRWVNLTGLLFALLQSACSAVLALSGFRVLIGLGALAAAAGVNTPPKGFHQDAIRIPMMALALIGALANLYMLWRVRSLRARSSSQWRMQPVTPAKRRSERLQFALAVITLILLAAERVAHYVIHHG
ncbi:hypothetical protein [Edaphobacter bradus]|uniref:hypothetical protein n=1 Tax=Edaphobacter bradus TaxID=2259016 RepID=UPI0021E07D22|nr:hypothetical protein [Edaphobacter bradus]